VSCPTSATLGRTPADRGLYPPTEAPYRQRPAGSRRADSPPRVSCRSCSRLTCSVATTYLIAASTMANVLLRRSAADSDAAMTWPSSMSGTPPPIAEESTAETKRRG